MYFIESVTLELEALHICLKSMILVKYLLDNYFRSRAAIHTLI